MRKLQNGSIYGGEPIFNTDSRIRPLTKQGASMLDPLHKEVTVGWSYAPLN